MSHVPLIAAFIGQAAAAAVAVAVAGTGQAFASTSPEVSGGPVFTGQSAPRAHPSADPGRLGDPAPCERLAPGLVHQDQRAAGYRRRALPSSWGSSGTRPPAAPAVGTILAVQGGPGFRPLTTRRTTGGRSARWPGVTCSWSTCAAPEKSSAFLCRPLQRWKTASGIAAYTIDTGKCGRQLDHTRSCPGHGRCRPARCTTNAARDVALLRCGRAPGPFLRRLLRDLLRAGAPPRYAKMLRSVTLDAAYPVSGTDPFYPQTILTARRAFDISCLRSVACRRAAPGRVGG